jgi:GMP synthase (glutamine-hydrolysing)
LAALASVINASGFEQKEKKMRCLAIRHVGFEDLGIFEPVLKDQGFDIEYFQSGTGDYPQREWDNAELAVVLGGPIGVNDRKAYPFIDREIDLIKRRIDTGKPLIGICLGAQMIAAAFGASVYPGKQKEIGWGSVRLTEAGKRSCLSALDGDMPVLHWHGDTFDLPKGATLLASTEITPHQAFSYGSNVLALQFHPEADGERIEAWLIGHACELAHNNIDPVYIRTQTRQLQQQAKESGQRLLSIWLEEAMRLA